MMLKKHSHGSPWAASAYRYKAGGFHFIRGRAGRRLYGVDYTGRHDYSRFTLYHGLYFDYT